MPLFPFEPLPFIAITSLMFALPGTVYLLRLQPRTRATFFLISFFICLNLILLSIFLVDPFLVPLRILVPAQDMFVILGGCFLMRFAYHFPRYDPARRGFWALGVMVVLLLLTIGNVIYYAWHYYGRQEWLFSGSDWYKYLSINIRIK